MTAVDLPRTRDALHAVAELVLAGPQYTASRRIDLRVSPGGFSTCAKPALAVVGIDLVVDEMVFPISGRTSRELAISAGLVAGAPLDVYPQASSANLDDPLFVDPSAAEQIADAYAEGDAALRLLAPDIEPVLWPEHFDVGIRVDNINYGVSPGDLYLAEPYAYVGIAPVPPDDPYWNAPFGIAQPMTSFHDAADVRNFFVATREHRR